MTTTAQPFRPWQLPYLAPPTQPTIQAAQRTVAAHARDQADLVDLLHTLGIDTP